MTTPKPRDSQKESLLVVCPNCNAQPGQPCTQPTETGRRNVQWIHYARFGRMTGWGE